MSDRLRALRLVLTVTAAAIAWTGLALQASITVPIRMEQGGGLLGATSSMLGSFTVLTHAIAALSLTIALVIPASAIGRRLSSPTAATGIALGMLAIGAAYTLVLRNVWYPLGVHRVANVFLHYLGPASYLVYWGFVVPRSRSRDGGIPSLLATPFGASAIWLAYPFTYLIAALVIGSMTGSYPYFFIDLGAAGPARVLVNCVWIGAGFLLSSFVLMSLDRFKPITR